MIKIEVMCENCNRIYDREVNTQPSIPGDSADDIRPELNDDLAQDALMCPKCRDRMKIISCGC